MSPPRSTSSAPGLRPSAEICTPFPCGELCDRRSGRTRRTMGGTQLCDRRRAIVTRDTPRKCTCIRCDRRGVHAWTAALASALCPTTARRNTPWFARSHRRYSPELRLRPQWPDGPGVRCLAIARCIRSVLDRTAQDYSDENPVVARRLRATIDGPLAQQ